jgi:prophage DNA circulation protein
MFRPDAAEAAPICDRVLSRILELAPTKGRPGSDLRTAVGDFIANAEPLIANDEAGPPLDEIFDLARRVGMTYPQFESVRVAAVAETPKLLGAVLIQNALIKFTLATQARIVADMSFVSREEVDTIKATISAAFEQMQDIAADDMDQASYMALIQLHAAIAFHLNQTARPLPRMLDYAFADVLPSLVLAYRLYADAGRADELRAENGIVHPGFCLREGRALSG